MCKKLLVIGKVWPEPRSSAAGTRILQIISIFQEKGYSVTFSSAAKRNEFSAKLSDSGIQEISIELNNNSFNDFIAALNPEVVLFDRYMTEEQFGWRVIEKAPNALRILDTEDLHFLRRARELAFKSGADPLTELQPFLQNEIMVRELASILRSDLSIMISDFEIELLQNEFNISASKLLLLPLLVTNYQINQAAKTPGFNGRSNFVTIGNFLHPPNRDSVLFLKEKIWPEIYSSNPGTELHVYGAYPDQNVWNLQDVDSGFIIKGRVEDVHQNLSLYRVMLAPIRFGAGQKGKLLDAMCAGLPSVTTDVGSEGMKSEQDWPGFVGNHPVEFIQKAVDLYSDKSIWEQKKSNISQTLKDGFNFHKFTTEFWIYFEELLINNRQIRSKDYLGEVLRYQSNNATKYMGKWIEEKNKKSKS